MTKTIPAIKTVEMKVRLRPIVVRGNKTTGQGIITIPMHSNIKIGDKVVVSKVVEGDIDE